LKVVHQTLAFFFGSIISLILVGCGEEKYQAQTPLVYQQTDVLIFLKEQMLELRADTANILIQVPINKDFKLPLGVFKINEQHLVALHPDFPKDLILEADTVFHLQNALSPTDFETVVGYLRTTTHVYVFPNYALGKQQFQPCLRCSPQTAALYSSLWLYWRSFNK